MKQLIFILILSAFYCDSYSQNNKSYNAIDKVMAQIPASSTLSTKGLSDYINLKFENADEKSRAIFIWIANNIQYDIKNIRNQPVYHSSEEIILSVLKSHKGVCMHYAELFNDIAGKVGIKSFVISGYTRQNGSIDNLAHAWCACKIDSRWYMYDPTWGAGYIQQGQYVKQLNNAYFKIKPELFIASHIPFDPLWQFLNYIVTNQEFYDQQTSVNKNKPFFNYTDSLKKYDDQTPYERLVYSKIRIENNGLKNQLIVDNLVQIRSEIKNHLKNNSVDLYNSAVKFFNDGIDLFNDFIRFRNRQFTPQKSDDEIRHMIEITDAAFDHAQKQLRGIEFNDADISATIKQLQKNINQAKSKLDGQKAFVEKYVNTSKNKRNRLFSKL